MNYVQVNIDVSGQPDYLSDVLSYYLAEAGYECFEKADSQLLGYVPQPLFSEPALHNIVGEFPYHVFELPDKDWNEEWEKHYFEPVLVDNKCVIYSSFHRQVPEATYRIVIEPKMSFGTGHHQTTAGMLRWILAMPMQGKRVLDMGCGTGVLGILAKMRGASEVVSVDIDTWCVENARESAELNHTLLEIYLGDAQLLSELPPFDVILANINRNILCADMERYVQALKPEGNVVMSGFYREDLPMIQARAEQLGLRYVTDKEEDNWVAAKFSRNG